MELKISINISSFKEKNNLSMATLSKLLRVNYSAIENIIEGKQLGKINTIRNIATNLGITIDQLLFEEVQFN